MMKSEQLLRAEGINVKYNNREVLHNLSLTFPEHQITAVMGPSGCGKSTFLRCLNRSNDLLPEVEVHGKVWLGDQDIYQPRTNVYQLRARVGMVYQQPVPFPFTIFENVVFGLKMAGQTDDKLLAMRVEASLKAAAIWDEVKDRLQEPAQALSGGQQQRVCLASVLAMQPEVILLDEPTSALDPTSSASIEQTLIALKKDYTIIIVTHNLQQASRISDQVAFMLDGDLIETAPTKTFFLQPQQPQTQDYLAGKFG